MNMAKYDLLRPTSKEEVRPFLASAFSSQKGNKGSHSVLDTDWKKVLEEFNGLYDTSGFLKNLQSKQEDIDILDEGCGSSLTLFQAIEQMEMDRTYLTNGYGVTASPEFLMQSAIPIMKEEILRNFKGSEKEKRTLELVLNGVQHNDTQGFHRYSPNGNIIRIVKGDLHYLSEVLSGRKFNLVYSSATYPHLECPGLAIEESANLLKQNGLLVVDSLPIFTLVDSEGQSLSVEESKRRLDKRNPNYRIYMKSGSNPFYVPVAIERRTEEPFNVGGLYLATDLNRQNRVVNVLD